MLATSVLLATAPTRFSLYSQLLWYLAATLSAGEPVVEGPNRADPRPNPCSGHESIASSAACRSESGGEASVHELVICSEVEDFGRGERALAVLRTHLGRR